MERELSSFEQLDKVLDYCYEFNLTITSEQKIQEYFKNDDKMSSLGAGDISLILNKLDDDGYITNKMHGVERQYRIIWNGKYFKEHGGYTQQQKDLITIKEDKEKYDARMKSNAIRLTIGTWVLAVFTLFLVLVEFLKHDNLYHLFRCCCHY
jgi:hypothetical protein